MMSKIKNIFFSTFQKLRSGMLQMFSANVLNKLVSMISSMVITRILSLHDYGIWGYILNMYGYLQLVTGLGLIAGAFQFGAENKGKEKEFSFFKYCLYTGLKINTVLVIVFSIGISFVQLSFPEAEGYIKLIAPLLLLEYGLDLLLTVLRCENRISEYARILNINTLLTATGICVGAFFGIGGVIAGRYIACFISLGNIVIKTKKETKKIYNANSITGIEKRELWRYSAFTGVSSMLNLLLNFISVTMIAALLVNAEDIAQYKVATLIPSALNFIPLSVVTVILPGIVVHNKDIKWLKINIAKTIAAMCFLNFLLCIVLILMAPQIISLISGEQYLPAVPAFRILVASYFFAGTFRTLGANILAALRCVECNLFVSFATIVCNIPLNLYLINRLGVNGAAYATLLSTLVASVLVMFFMLIYLNRKKKANKE